jgi:DNA-binding PadR family transcriptional regulator
MPNQDIASTLKDPDFQGLPDSEKQKFLSKYVPEFGQLPADEQTKFMTKYVHGPLGGQPAPPSLTEQYMAQHGTTPDYGDIQAMRPKATGPSITATNAPDWWERTKNFFRRDQQADIDQATNERMAEIKAQREGKPAPTPFAGVLDKPMLPVGSFVSQELEQNPGYHQQGIGALSTIQGLGAASADVVSGLSTPRNLAIIGALAVPGAQTAGYAMLVNRLIAAGFSADMAKGAADELVAGYTAARNGDTAEATRHFTSGSVSAAFAILSGAHAGRPGIRAEYKAGAEAPPEGHDVAPPKPVKPPTKVTLAQEGHLVTKLGYSKEQVANMTPQDAHDVITKARQAQPEDFPTPPPAPTDFAGDDLEDPRTIQYDNPNDPQGFSFSMPNPQDLPAHVAAQARLAQIAHEKGYDVPTYLKKVRDERLGGTADIEDQHALDDAESYTSFAAEKAVNTTMADKMRTALSKVGEKDQLAAHLEGVATENLYESPDDMARSLEEKKGLGKALTPTEKEALAQYKRMQSLPEFKLRDQASQPETGSLGQPPKPPSSVPEAATKPPIAASQTPKAPTRPQVPTAKSTQGPYSPQQVSWLTGLFKGKAEMGTIGFDVAAGHYGDTDAMLDQMQQAGLIEEHGREVVGRGADKKVYPTYKLTDEGMRLRRHWASQQFPGEAPEFTPAPQSATPPADTGGAATAESESPAKPPVQPLFEGEEAEGSKPEVTEPVVSKPQHPDAEKHIAASGMVGTPLVSDDINSPVMIEHPLLKGQGLQATMKREDINSPAAVKAALRNKLDELKAPIPDDLKTKDEKEAEADVYKPGQEVAGIKGKKTKVLTTTGSHDAVYRVVEAEDLKPSHNPQTFQRNEKYQIENERQYHNNTNAQAQTEKYAKDAEWALFVNGDPTASNGPSQSLPDGTVLGGNGRSMALQLAYGRVGTGDLYKQYLIDHADEFGIDPAKVAEMRHPVLDRMLTDAGESKKQLGEIGKALNKPFAKQKSTVESAVSAGTSLSLDSARKIGESISSLGDEASLRKLFTEDPKMVRDIALQDGILAEGDLPQYFHDDGTLNDSGKDFFENALLGSVVRDAELLEKMPAAIRGKLERILAPVLEVGMRPDSWNIGDALRDALREATAASANGKNISDWVNQTGFDKDGNMKPPMPEDVATLAVALSKKPTEVAALFKRFASEARQDIPGQEGMFGAPDPREAFDRIFKGEGGGGTNAATAFRSQPRSQKMRAATGVAPAPRPKTADDYMEIPTRPMESPVKEFYKEDVVPTAKSAFDGAKEAWRRLRNVVAPVNSENLNTALNIRKFGAEQTRTMHQFKYSMEDAWDFFTKFDRVARMHNVSMVDAGKGAELAQELGVPEVEQWVNLAAKARNDAWQQALKYRGAEASALTRPDYWLGHYYVLEDGSSLGTVLSKRSLEGGKSFLKKREFPTMAEFIDYADKELGLKVKPKFDNPVEFEAAKLNEITNYLKGQKILEAQEAAGRVKVVHALDPNTPEGYSKLPDNLGTIYAPPTYTIDEAFDDLLMKRIDALAKSLGVSHTRAAKIRGQRWGYSTEGASSIVTKAGGPESVITHELGHVMDDRYGLADKWVNDSFMKQEFRDLADLRAEQRSPSDGFKKYIRRGEEKIANAFHAYVHNPEAMDAVAPTVKRAIDLLIDQHKELRPLREIKPSQVLGTAQYETSTGHIGIAAYRYVPDADIPLYRNYTSEGLRSNPVFNGYRQAANFMNSLQLGFSGFHAGFTANDAAASRFALGAQKIAHGDVMGWREGSGDRQCPRRSHPAIYDRARGCWTDTRPETLRIPHIARALDLLIRAGGADRMDDFYRTGAVHSFYDEMRAGNGIGAA